MKELLIIILAVGLSIWLWPEDEVWSGIIYPDAGNLIAFERIGDFESLPACLDGVYARINLLENPRAADFECGLNCRPYSDGSDLQICEETRDSL